VYKKLVPKGATNERERKSIAGIHHQCIVTAADGGKLPGPSHCSSLGSVHGWLDDCVSDRVEPASRLNWLHWINNKNCWIFSEPSPDSLELNCLATVVSWWLVPSLQSNMIFSEQVVLVIWTA
jgi:hypothetical protein